MLRFESNATSHQKQTENTAVRLLNAFRIVLRLASPEDLSRDAKSLGQ